MALLQPRPAALLRIIYHQQHSPILKRHTIQQHTSRRTFILGLPNLHLTPSLQHISASRTLPYASIPIFQTIAQVPQYASFLPYCLSSTVTRWSRPDAEFGQRWPEEAVLEIGWGAVHERFASRIYCVPGRVIEAVAGTARTSVGGRELAHHTHMEDEKSLDGGSGEILTHLMTRWEVEPVVKEVGAERTKVTLDIEFQFANPVYAAMSQVAAGAVAEKMIEAFENRIRGEVGSGGSIGTKGEKKSSLGHGGRVSD